MRILVDAQALLWWLDDPSLLSEPARAAMRDGQNEVLVSAATIWEIVIKQALGKLQAPDDLGGAIASCRFATLPVTMPHALAVRVLPAIHRDPFDRMLVAQAMVERTEIVTRDPAILQYEVRCIPA
jgi:PIN domain nuclease of toxin-antitoxin system